MNILVTGATGFIGQRLIEFLITSGHHVIAAVRQSSSRLPEQVKQIEIGDLAEFSSTTLYDETLNSALAICQVVVHLAARAHVISDTVVNRQKTFDEINVNASLKLAAMAAEQGVERFVFLSSIGVNGNQTKGTPFSEQDNPAPQEEYAVSKWRAEQALFNQTQSQTMSLVIIRPPLVYGANAPGNFGSLVKWVKRGIPLPLGAVHNQRSLIALDNLVSFIELCIASPKAADQIFVIADDEVVSTTKLLQAVASGMGRSARLLSVPVIWMSALLRFLGKPALVIRLFGSLTVNNQKAKTLLGWRPVTTMEQQLAKLSDAAPHLH